MDMTIDALDRLKRINEMIKLESTGNPKEFSKQLGLSESHLYRCLNEIKDMGAPVKYSKRKNSYYYSKPFEIKVSYSIELISNEECSQIYAGFCLNNLQTTFL